MQVHIRSALLLAAVLWAPFAAQSASSAYAAAQVGFPDRVIGVYTATDSSDQTLAEAGIGFARISGSMDNSPATRDLAGTRAYSRTDFSVQGLLAETPLTFTWRVQGGYNFTMGGAAWGWDAFAGVSLSSPLSGGSYSAYGNLVVQDLGGQLGDPTSIVACNGDTRGQDFCGQRFDLRSATFLSVHGVADGDTFGYIEQNVGGDGYGADFSGVAELVSVTTTALLSGPAYLLWEDGSQTPILPAGNVPEPGTWAMMLVGLVGCAWCKRAAALPGR